MGVVSMGDTGLNFYVTVIPTYARQILILVHRSIGIMKKGLSDNREVASGLILFGRYLVGLTRIYLYLAE